MKTVVEMMRDEVNLFRPLSLEEQMNRERDNVEQILQTYNGKADILSELVQNAYDAIRENQDIETGDIKIVVDKYQRKISVQDNGIGIAKERVPNIFWANVGYKKKKGLIGEKGVGLTFILYSCNEFRLTTNHKGGLQLEDSQSDSNESCYEVTMKGANQWLSSSLSKAQPKVELKSCNSEVNSFTKIEISDINNEQAESLFEMDLNSLKMFLRTRTAIGDTFTLFNKQPKKKMNIHLDYIDVDGIAISGPIEYGYPAPHKLDKRSILLNDRIAQMQTTSEALELVGVPIYFNGEYGEEIDYYCFLGSRQAFHKIDQALELGDQHLSPVITLAVKGFPTHVDIPIDGTLKNIPQSGTLFSSNLFIVFNSDKYKLDYGRRTIRGRAYNTLKNAVAKEIYPKIKKHIKDIVGRNEEMDSSDSQFGIFGTWNSIANYPNMEIESFPFDKEPTNEQGVIALFYLFTGKGVFSDDVVTSLNCTVDNTYDWYFKLGKEGQKDRLPRIGEFKFHGKSLDADIRNGIKHSGDIHLLVCWDVDIDKHSPIKFKKTEECDRRMFNDSTHVMTSDVIRHPIEVICLKDVVARLKKMGV